MTRRRLSNPLPTLSIPPTTVAAIEKIILATITATLCYFRRRHRCHSLSSPNHLHRVDKNDKSCSAGFRSSRMRGRKRWIFPGNLTLLLLKGGKHFIGTFAGPRTKRLCVPNFFYPKYRFLNK